MILGFVVLAHREAEQLAMTLSALGHPSVRIYLHVDAGVDLGPFRSALSDRALEDVVLLPRLRSLWGGIEAVDAALAGLARAVADGCDYVVLISGQDVPVWPIERIVQLFSSAPGRSYLSFFPLPDARWQHDGRLRTECYSYTVFGRRETCVPPGFPVRFSAKGWLLNSLLRVRSAFKPPRTFPSCARAFGGSSWWNLSRAAAEYVLDFVEGHPDYRAYHEHTLCPDEIFFQSILLGTGFVHGHEIVNDELRHMEWVEGASHPRDLSVEDVPGMLASGKPFARKVTGDSAVAVRDAIAAARGQE